MKRWLFLILLLASSAHAQDGAPNFPKTFDAPTVSRMIAEVDKGSNFPVLKVGYFLGKTRPPFPVSSGLQLLETSVKKEKRASKRWFLMQWLRAFGTLRNGPDRLDKAMVIYGGIFQEANRTSKIPEATTLRRIVDDFVFNVPTGLVAGRGQDTEFTEIALQEAIKTHFRLGSPLRRLQGKARPDFAAAVAAASSNDRVWASLVEEAEKNTAISKSYDFYFSAEQIVRASNKSGYPHLKSWAITLLEKGEKLLPPDDPRHEEAKRERENLRAELDELPKPRKPDAEATSPLTKPEATP